MVNKTIHTFIMVNNVDVGRSYGASVLQIIVLRHLRVHPHHRGLFVGVVKRKGWVVLLPGGRRLAHNLPLDDVWSLWSLKFAGYRLLVFIPAQDKQIESNCCRQGLKHINKKHLLVILLV